MKLVTNSFILAAAIALLVSSSTAQASISVGDYQNSGDGLLTIDTDTGLEWLDWTETTNRSYDDVSGQFGAGGDFEGWRHATSAEVRVLMNNLTSQVDGTPYIGNTRGTYSDPSNTNSLIMDFIGSTITQESEENYFITHQQ